MELRGATALVTGGGHRLGRHIALGLASAGANVVINYHRSAAAAADTARDAAAYGVRAIALQADAADPDQMRALLAKVDTELPPIDLLVANAGVFRRTPLDATTEADWDDMMRLNFTSFLVPAQLLGERMRARGAGCIVALADVAALRPWGAYLPYCVAKRCVVALAQGLARELAPAVRVNAIAPGPVLFPDDFDPAARQREIDRTLLRRAGDPADIAAAVLYLARNDYVTGSVLPVDGGRLLS